MNTSYQSNVLPVNFTGTSKTKIEQENITSGNNLQDAYNEDVTNLCIQHQISKKWILVIDDDNAAIALSKKTNIDKSKILHLNNRKITVNVNNIEVALAKGNCSAVILGNNNFAVEQLQKLTACAQQSNTAFMVLNKTNNLH